MFTSGEYFVWKLIENGDRIQDDVLMNGKTVQ